MIENGKILLMKAFDSKSMKITDHVICFLRKNGIGRNGDENRAYDLRILW